jgi:hypothetical protein
VPEFLSASVPWLLSVSVSFFCLLLCLLLLPVVVYLAVIRKALTPSAVTTESGELACSSWQGASGIIIRLAQCAQVVGEVMSGSQGVGVVGAQDPAGAELCRSNRSRRHLRRRGPASAPGSAVGRAGRRTPGHTLAAQIQAGSFAAHTVLPVAGFLAHPLSRSRAPPLGRPAGRRRAIASPT